MQNIEKPWRKKGTAFQQWSTDHDLGLICCIRAWTACDYRGKNYFQVYQGILQGKVRVAVCQLKLSWSWRCGKTMTLNIKSKSTEWLKNSAFSSGPVRAQIIKPIEMLLNDLKRAIHANILGRLSWSNSVRKNGPKTPSEIELSATPQACILSA